MLGWYRVTNELYKSREDAIEECFEQLITGKVDGIYTSNPPRQACNSSMIIHRTNAVPNNVGVRGVEHHLNTFIGPRSSYDRS